VSLKESIEANFLDQDALVSPNPCSPTTRNASNNGLIYSGEYQVLLSLLGQYSNTSSYITSLEACYAVPGCLRRSPINNTDYESPDDYYGVIAGLYFTRSKSQAKLILKYGLSHWGSFNNITPGCFSWTTMIWRQPQLLAMNLWAAGYSITLLNAFSALVIAFSCLGCKKTDGCDPWRLTWLLVQCGRRNSWFCRVASKIWYRRLNKTWGGMGNIYAEYYKGLPGQEHPFTTAMRELDSRR
jgi:hypothetical protein